MYRRLKNLLGVSLIIFAILLSQIPMPEVQADSKSETENVTVTFQYGFVNLNPSVEKVTIPKGSTVGIDTIEITIDGGQRIALIEGNKYTIDATVYQFDGWCDTSTTGPKWDMASSKADTDTSLYAVWERVDGEQFSYESVMNEADAVTSQDADGSAATTKTINIVFNFGFPEEYFKDDSGNSTLPADTEDENGVAVLKVTQKVDAETGTVIAQAAIKDFLPNSSHTLKIGSSTRSATLLNWHTEQNFVWDFNKMITSDMTLYATWNLGDSECTITYQAADADQYSVQTKIVKIGSKLPKPDNIPVRAGYKITNWYLDATTSKTQVDWNQKVASDMTLYAGWEANGIVVTFDLNGGTESDLSNTKIEKVVEKGTKLSDVVSTIDASKISNDPYETDTFWYQDQECFTKYNTTAVVNSNLTLYKKWIKTDSNGFVLSADGKYLYEYKGNANSNTKIDVKIPDTVVKIGPKAFSDMSNIRSVTLPSAISSIAGDAFCGIENVADEVYILAADTTSNSVSYQRANELANKYSKFVYTSYLKPETVVMNVDSSSFASNTASGISNVSSYVNVTASGIEPDNYYVKISSNAKTNEIKNYFEKEDQKKVYYLDISMTKGISGTPDYQNTMNYTITFPLPDQWQNWDITTDNLKVYSKDYTTSELETLTVKKIVNDNGVKCVRFTTWHFSPFVLAFDGTIPDNNGDNGNNNGGNSGGNSGGNGGNSSGGGGSSDGGSSSGGGGSSDSGSSSGGSSGSSGSSGTNATSGTAGAGGAGGATADITQTSTQPGGTDAGSGNGVGTSGGGSASGTGHVKDSTPKTGDPLEYRTIMVCGLFSMGVLMLLIGNKKKTSAFSRYRRA